MGFFSSSPSSLACPRCGTRNVLPACNNCGSIRLHRGVLSNNMMGIFCKDCNMGFVWVDCVNCGTRLPAEKFG